jgi:hypothetical protein
MIGMAASDTATVATSYGQSESKMAALLGCSLSVPLLELTDWQLLTRLDWYQFSALPLS